MQKILILICCCGIILSSCKKETDIGSPRPLTDDYTLPQGDASQAANDKIKDIYDTYGSYLIYEYTQKDIDWTVAAGSSNSKAYVIDKTDPANVESAVNFLEKAWFKFIPDEKLKKEWLPYRVFITDSIRQPRVPGTYSPSQRNPFYYPYRVNELSIAFGGVYAWKAGMNAATAVAEKNKVNYIVWAYYIDKGFVDLSPLYQQMIELSDYTYGTGYNAPDETVYQRGFAPYLTISTTTTFSLTQEVEFPMLKTTWHNFLNQWQPALTNAINDTKGFVYYMLTTDQSVVAPALAQYPLFKEKYDIVRTYVVNNYGIDPQDIGNANAGFTFN